MSKVVRIRRKNGRVVQGCDVYIGRRLTMGGWSLEESKWANPFRVGQDGTREEVIKKYRKYILKNKKLMAALPELKNKVLGCWCKPEACHGDVLVDLAANSELLRNSQ